MICAPTASNELASFPRSCLMFFKDQRDFLKLILSILYQSNVCDK
jgi:hypothetical protein